MATITLKQIREKHRRGERIAMLTAYDATFARLLDGAGVDMLLVGDSLGMVIQGHESTIPVTLDEVIYHTRCASRGASHAMVVADLPFMSYQVSGTQALLAAGRAMKEGRAGAVKLEGGLEMAEAVRLMVAAGIPVMAHIGLRPQRVHQMGGYVKQGRTAGEAQELIAEAKAFEEAGAFSLVLEGVAIETAREITESVTIPTIGIGSGPCCSGQVLVIYDLLGLNPEFRPSFLKVYADGSAFVSDAVRRYVDEVRSGTFPAEAHGFHQNR
jgi:3-methyl-2-oxobutanoate hydroxymethyltransferase